MWCSTRLSQGVLWLKSLTDFLGCRAEYQAGGQRDTCFESCGWVDEDTEFDCTPLSPGHKAGPPACGNLSRLLAKIARNKEVGSGAQVKLPQNWGSIFSGSDVFFFSGNEVYVDRNKVIELPSCIHRGVRNWSWICRVSWVLKRFVFFFFLSCAKGELHHFVKERIS